MQTEPIAETLEEPIMDNKVLEMKSIVKSYIVGEEEQVVLKGINLDVYKGEFVAILRTIRLRQNYTYEYYWMLRCAYNR